MTKGLEELKRLAFETACIRCQYYVDKQCWNRGECVWKTIEKELKALEIINKKDVDVAMLRNSKSYEQYNNFLLVYMTKTAAKKMFLNKEQFEAIKEVLV